MVHDLLRMNVVIAQQVNIIILAGECPVLGPAVVGRVLLELAHALSAVGEARQRPLLLHQVLVAVPVYPPAKRGIGS